MALLSKSRSKAKRLVACGTTQRAGPLGDSGSLVSASSFRDPAPSCVSHLRFRGVKPQILQHLHTRYIKCSLLFSQFFLLEGYTLRFLAMDFRGQKSWTPLESGDGDLGTTYRPVDLSGDTSYRGYGGRLSSGASLSQFIPYQEGYEMNYMSE